ncbi:MAG: DUF1512 domain-containing protein [Sulfolobales archaeon]|nr:DUF1512 domain-containing protein [Sulfolobales archaeon]MDW8082198.1 DUF1512 domain-containing protein [Sulfolobales archaeon]
MNGSSDVASYLIVVLFLASLLMNFTDIPQRIQLHRFSSFVRRKLYAIEEMEVDARRKAVAYMSSIGIKEPSKILEGFTDNFFLIRPVDIEPTDIIRRFKHLIRVRENSVREYVRKVLDTTERSIQYSVETVLEVVSVLRLLNKLVRHYLELGLKYNNWILVMQLAIQMPELVEIARAYVNSLNAFTSGIPIGDSVGPLVAKMLVNLQENSREISEGTDLYETEVDGRKIYVIKASGPGSNVGWPGEALEKLVEELGGTIDRIITVDAALKLESEESGEVAYGTGAAIGDIGPEKIAMERVASKYSIPIDAVVVKMSEIEALSPISRNIYEGVVKSYELVQRVIREKVREGGTVVVVGVGNTVGVK